MKGITKNIITKFIIILLALLIMLQSVIPISYAETDILDRTVFDSDFEEFMSIYNKTFSGRDKYQDLNENTAPEESIRNNYTPEYKKWLEEIEPYFQYYKEFNKTQEQFTGNKTEGTGNISQEYSDYLNQKREAYNKYIDDNGLPEDAKGITTEEKFELRSGKISTNFRESKCN